MGLLEQLGWSPRTPGPARHTPENDRSDEEPDVRWRWLVRGGLFLGLLALTVGAFPRGDLYEYTVSVGDTWNQPTLTAPFKFPIYLDPQRVKAQRDSARKNTILLFQKVPTARRQMAANRDTLRQQLKRILGAYSDYRYHQQQGDSEQARRDSARYTTLRRNAQLTLSTRLWDRLAQQHYQKVQGLSSSSRSEGQEAEKLPAQRMLEAAFRVGAQLLSAGVLNRPRDSIQTQKIIIRNKEEQTQRTVDKNNQYGLNEAYEWAEDQISETFNESPGYSQISYSMFRAIFEPSLQYMRAETMQKRDRRAQSVTAIQGGVKKGESIVQQGQQVTEEIKRKLSSLEREMDKKFGPRILQKRVTGETLYTALGLVFLFLYLYFLRPAIWWSDRDMSLVALILGFIVVLFGVGVRVSWPLYVVPVALASVLLTILFDSQVGLFATLILAFTGGQMLGLDLEYTLATFFAGSFGIFSVRDIKNRGQFVVSGGLVFLGYLLVLGATWFYLDVPLRRFGRDLVFAGIGSVITITASFFLWALEKAFDITTDLTLLELSDTNRPLLKELSLRAPGSFNHTLQVANLAEAAADRVGAHALLTRVGALYHDIGKMLKPEYFVENQRADSNPHDRLKPRMSALIIASHVKEGLEMGKEHNLPERVLKFIPMHHGTARIEYFYQEAVGLADDGEASVPESEFRYPGPKPDSRESGILMLADSVEAASRSLDDPTPHHLENLINLIFREQIDDGQLDNTDLTFRDLSRIKDTFLKMLLGIYHVRVKYPDQKNDAEEKDYRLVSLRAEDPYTNVSVAYIKDGWPHGEVPGAVASPSASREPRHRLAEASPHSSVDQLHEGDLEARENEEAIAEDQPPRLDVSGDGNVGRELDSD
jgi:putative nucleotidyltransferase with HDIG domain